MGWLRRLAVTAAALVGLTCLVVPAHANEAAIGWCQSGAQNVITSGLTSATQVQASYPSCTVTVTVHGGATATIYSDNLSTPTPLANPFTAQTGGLYEFYAANGHYDIVLSGGGLPSPVTYSDVLLSDPGAPGGLLIGTYTVLPFSATPTFNASAATTYQITLTANVTSSIVSNASTGQYLGMLICENGVGGFTFAWPANFLNPPSVVTAASTCNDYIFVYDGTNWRLMTPVGSGSSFSFSSITTGANTAATMTVSTGASLTASGSGTITATALPFSGITGGTNVAAAMVVGTGGSLAVSGSGSIAATTAAATASSPTNCPSGQAASGINSSFAAQNCTPFNIAGAESVYLTNFGYSNANFGRINDGQMTNGMSVLTATGELGPLATLLAAGKSVVVQGFETSSTGANPGKLVLYTTCTSATCTVAGGNNTVTLNATSACSTANPCTNLVFAWFVLQDTAYTNWCNAIISTSATAMTAGILPGGIIGVDEPCQTSGSKFPVIIKSESHTQFIPVISSAYNASASYAGLWFGFANSGPNLAGYYSYELDDVELDGMGMSGSAACGSFTTSMKMLFLSQGLYHDIKYHDHCDGSMGGGQTTLDNFLIAYGLEVTNAGEVTVQGGFQSTPTKIIGGRFLKGSTSGPTIQVNSSLETHAVDYDWIDVGMSNTVWDSYGDTCAGISTGSVGCVDQVGTGAMAYIDGGTAATQSGHNVFKSTGGSLYVHDVTITPGGGGAVAFDASGGGNIFDLGGNTSTTNTGAGYGAPTGIQFIANASSTGTTANKLAKLTGAPSTAVITTAADTTGAVGICITNCGTTGNAGLQATGIAYCVFDGATTAGHYVTQSSSTNGDCTDGGATVPTATLVFGRILSTNASAGTYQIVLSISNPNPISGQANGVIPLATGATTVGAQSHCDDGVTTTSTITCTETTVVSAISVFQFNNATSTGTTTNKLAKLTGAPSTATITSAGDTSGAIGICIINCGTSGKATIQAAGLVSCVFDGATTAGHYVQQSASVNGDCSDAGASVPTIQSFGRVLSTNASAGTYQVDMDLAASAPVSTGGTVTSVATSSPITGGTITSTGTIACATCVTSAAALTSKGVVIGQGMQAAATIDFPDVKVIPAANCNNSGPTAGPAWSLPSGGNVSCRSGTNNIGGFISITDTSTTFAQFAIEIPEDWDTGANPYIRFGIASTDTTSGHTIIPAIKVSCAKGDGTTTDDVAYNASHSLSTTTLNATANQFWSGSNVQMNSTDVTGCVAGAMMVIQVGRATDTATNAEFYYAVVTFPRLITVQAN